MIQQEVSHQAIGKITIFYLQMKTNKRQIYRCLKMIEIYKQTEQ